MSSHTHTVGHKAHLLHLSSSVGELKAPRSKFASRAYTALAAALLCSTTTPLRTHAQDSAGLAPNGRAWIEGDKNFNPKVNSSLRKQIQDYDQLIWSMRRFASTNDVPHVAMPTNCVGVIPPQRMKEIFIEWVNRHRARHGLAPVTYGMSPTSSFTEQDQADTALYQAKLYDSGRMSTHFPAQVTDAPNFNCLTQGIIDASAGSLLATISGPMPIYIGYYYPVEYLNMFLRDTASEVGHRLALLDQKATVMSASWTPINYTRSSVLGMATPISFTSSPGGCVVTVHSGGTSTSRIDNVVFPAAGWNLSSWSKSHVYGDPDWITMSIQSMVYDFTKKEPVVTVVDERNDKVFRGSFLTRTTGDGVNSPSVLAWIREEWPSGGVGTPIVKITVSNLLPIGAPDNAPTKSITWRVATWDAKDVEMEIVRREDRTEVSFPAAHLFDGWQLSRYAPFSPWQLECSDSPGFETLVGTDSLTSPASHITEQGRFVLSFDSASTPKYFRLKQKPGPRFVDLPPIP